jgi:hypothetical protein
MLPIVGVPDTVRHGLAAYREVFCRAEGFDPISRRSFWIPGSWNLRMVYTDDISFLDPRQESHVAGQYQESHR